MTSKVEIPQDLRTKARGILGNKEGIGFYYDSKDICLLINNRPSHLVSNGSFLQSSQWPDPLELGVMSTGSASLLKLRGAEDNFVLRFKESIGSGVSFILIGDVPTIRKLDSDWRYHKWESFEDPRLSSAGECLKYGLFLLDCFEKIRSGKPILVT